MVQLFPGLLYVLILTVIFTVLLVSFTALFLLSSARAIVRQRYAGSVLSGKNVKMVARYRPVLKTTTAVFLSLKDVESNRMLTTLKMPANVRLYEKCFFVKPLFTSGAYLAKIKDIKTVSIAQNALSVEFAPEDRTMVLQCRVRNLARWRDSLNALIINHK